MPTGTISDTTWAGVSTQPQPCESRLKARPYSVPRPAGAFLAAELTLLTILTLQATQNGGAWGATVLVVSCGVFFHLNNLDKSIVSSKTLGFSIDVLESTALGFLTAALLFYLFPILAPTTSTALAGATVAGFLPVVLRPVLGFMVNRRMLVEEILVVGTGQLAGKLHRALGDGRVQFKGTAERANRALDFPESPTDAGITVDFSQLNDMLVRDQISRVVIAEPDAPSRGKLAAALLDSRLRGLAVNDAVDFYEQFSGKLWVDSLNPEWFVYTNGFQHSRTGSSLNRALDILLALMLLLPAAPLLAIIAVAIKLDSPGPVLFRQIRVGLHGSTFNIYKFRSMRHDAESETGPVWACERDDRVTKVGRLLRKFRLDETLQAINVLRGEMSMVGPRPERPYFVNQLEQQIPFYSLRHYVKPGITGWAQVMYRYGASVEDAHEKLQYDLYYAKHKSLGFEAEILLKTIKIVLFGRGR